jgi:hypothetical protein
VKIKIINSYTNIYDSISNQLKEICIENKINIDKQNYHIFIEDSTIFKGNNGIFYTSGDAKYLSFYGRIYDDPINVEEVIRVNGEHLSYKIMNKSIVIFAGGVESSTKTTKDIKIKEFYIAPLYLIKGQDLSNWKPV